MRSWKGFSPGQMRLTWCPRCWEGMRWRGRVGKRLEARGAVRIRTLLHVLIQSTKAPHYEGILGYKLSTRMETPKYSARSTGLFLSLLMFQREAAIFHKVGQALRLSVWLLHLYLNQISACLKWAATSSLRSGSHALQGKLESMATAVWLHATRQCFITRRSNIWMLGTVSLCIETFPLCLADTS